MSRKGLKRALLQSSMHEDMKLCEVSLAYAAGFRCFIEEKIDIFDHTSFRCESHFMPRFLMLAVLMDCVATLVMLAST